MSCVRRVDTKEEVAGGCDVQWDMMLREIAHQCRILYGAYPVCNPLSTKSRERAPDALRPREFASVRRTMQPGAACPLEVRREGFWRRTYFCSSQSERHDTVVSALYRHAGHISAMGHVRVGSTHRRTILK